MIKQLFTATFVVVSSLLVEAQEKKRWSLDSLVSGHVNLIPLPIFQSSPETGLLGGLSVDYFFNSGTQTRPSFAWIQATYSSKKQIAIEPIWQIYGKDESWFYRGRGGYLDYSESFWGVGNTTLAEDADVKVFYGRAYFQGVFAHNFGNKSFLGFQYRYSNTHNMRFDSTGNLDIDKNINTSTVSGLGPVFILDHRDNPFSPLKGYYAEIAPTFHGKKIGSQQVFSDLILDFRQYNSWKDRHFLGFQAFGQFAAGDVPFKELPRLGNHIIMRGFTEGRYRDKQYMAFQSEYRYTINRFLGAAAFASAGKVARTFGTLDEAPWRYAGGVGLRLLFNKNKRLYTRVDFAVNDTGETGFYFRIMDAF